MKLMLHQVCKTYGKKVAVDHVDFCFTNGIYGLLGPNGSGKSTLMRLLCDILKPSEGYVTLEDQTIQDLDAEYRDILGYLPQEFGYYPEFSAYDFLLYFARLKGFSKKEGKQRVKDVIDQVSLSDVAKQKIKTYSGGMKQRLGIAQALLNDPKVLIVDEPTAGLDPKERNKFKNILARCAKDKIVILSTHIVSDVEGLATEIIMMKEGKLHLHGTRNELLKRMKNHVYTFVVNEEEALALQETYLVTQMTPLEQGILVRIVADQPPRNDARLVEPMLEDLYLHIFRDV